MMNKKAVYSDSESTGLAILGQMEREQQLKKKDCQHACNQAKKYNEII